MIVLTGVTGKLGSLIAEHLLRRVSGDQVAASTRDVSKAQAFAARGVRVRHGDYADRASLKEAFEGASQLLLISSNAAASGGDPLAQHRAAIDAAQEAGVRRIVYTSHMGASRSSAFPPMHSHAATEAMLADSGLAWTALRNGFYASTVPTLVGDAAISGVIAAPADGKVSWTTHADLAAAAAAVLLDEGRFDGPTPPLTAGQALDLDDVAALLSRQAGRQIKRHVISDADHATGLRARNVPDAAIAMSLALFRAARAGEFSKADPTLASLIGKLPATLADAPGALNPDADNASASTNS